MEKPSGAFLALTIAPPVLLLLVYLGGYVGLRSTDRLVHLAGGAIILATPSYWQDVYAPAIAVEASVRAVVDPGWSAPVAMPTSMMMDGS